VISSGRPSGDQQPSSSLGMNQRSGQQQALELACQRQDARLVLQQDGCVGCHAAGELAMFGGQDVTPAPGWCRLWGFRTARRAA